MTNQEIISRHWQKIEKYLIEERKYCPKLAKKKIQIWSKRKNQNEKKEGRNPLNNIAENVCMYAEYQGKYMKKYLIYTNV